MIDSKAYSSRKMKIDIEDKRRIIDLQDDFNRAFPYLKIEFFSIAHKDGAGTAKKFMISNGKTLGECRKQHTNGSFTINSKMTVTELETGFNTIYGLSVQLFRKSGRAWLETTVTDGWTLEEQNKEGEALSK